MKTKGSTIMRQRFAKGVAAGHAMRRAAKLADLAARNSYRVAIGLPPVTLDDKHLTK